MAGIFSKPKMPEPPPVTPMVDEAALAKARKRTLTSLRSRSGRESTVLGSAIGASDKLGS